MIMVHEENIVVGDGPPRLLSARAPRDLPVIGQAGMALAFTTDDGIGARATLGLILLQADETLENEARELLPTAGVALHYSRIVMPPVVSHGTRAGMTATLPVAAQLLPQADFDVIGCGCTSGATVIGPAGVAAAINRVHPAAKVTDPMSAVLAACRVRSLKRLGFVTPYMAGVSAAMRGFLRDAGFEIGAFGSFEQGDDRVVARDRRPRFWPRFNMSAAAPTAMASTFLAPTCAPPGSSRRRHSETVSR